MSRFESVEMSFMDKEFVGNVKGLMKELSKGNKPLFIEKLIINYCSGASPIQVVDSKQIELPESK